MDLRHLRYFVAVAEAGSVSLAARRLNGTQPALSRQIRDLEQDLGVRLFDRIGRKIVLTGDGDELLGAARRLLADAEAFRERAQTLGGGEGGILRIGATPQFIEAALPEVLARYHRARPGVEVRVIEDGAGPLIKRVHQGELHLAIGVLRAEGLRSRLLYPLRVLAVMRRRHRLARRRSLAVTELVGEKILLLERGFQTRDLFEEACRAAHVQLQVRIESRSPQSLVALAAGGHGIAILPSVVRLDRARVAIAGMLHDGRPLGLWSRVVWDSDRYLPTHAGAFIEILAGYMGRAYPGHGLGLARAIPRPSGA
jgi:DNA-binding transcriptional LysR family regulator